MIVDTAAPADEEGAAVLGGRAGDGGFSRGRSSGRPSQPPKAVSTRLLSQSVRRRAQAQTIGEASGLNPLRALSRLLGRQTSAHASGIEILRCWQVFQLGSHSSDAGKALGCRRSSGRAWVELIFRPGAVRHDRLRCDRRAWGSSRSREDEWRNAVRRPVQTQICKSPQQVCSALKLLLREKYDKLPGKIGP